MATVIYNHREMEYNCEKWWKQQFERTPDFASVIKKRIDLFDSISDTLELVNTFTFDEEYAMDYGMDTLRLYVLFEDVPKGDDFREGSLEGIYKFLNRFMTLVNNSVSNSMGIEHNERKELRVLDNVKEDKEIETLLWQYVYDIQEELEQAIIKKNLHSIVAAFMEGSTNIAQVSKKQEISVPIQILEQIAIMLSPFAPYMSEYVWHTLPHTDSVFEHTWPIMNNDIRLKKKDEIEIAVQVNGKTKKVIKVKSGQSKDSIEQIVKETLENRYPKDVERVIYVEDKIYNMITK